MKLILAKVLLGIAGSLLLVIGCAVLFQPETFAAANGVELADSPSLLSEFRAPGGLLLASAVIVLAGIVRRRFMRPAFALATLVYGSYGISRLIGVAADGMPSASLTQAMVIELLLGLICGVVLIRFDRQEERGAHA